MASSRSEEVTLRLVDAVTPAATAATNALARLEGQIKREQAALGNLQAKLGRSQAELKGLAAGAGGSVNVGQYRAKSDAISRMIEQIASKKDRIAGLKDALGSGIPDAAERGKIPLAAIAKSFKLLGGEFGAVEGKGVRIVGLLGKMGAVIGAVVGGVIVLGSAIAALGFIFEKAISGASELREETLKLQTASVRWWDSQRAGVGGALALQNAVNGVAASTALARDKVVDYAIQLRQARFTGKQLEGALSAMALAGAAGGDELAQKFLALAQNARYFGGNLEALEKRFKDKFGEVAEKKLRSLDVQMLKLRENFSFIFSGADIEPFLRGLQSVLSIFNRNEKAAQSLRGMVTKFTEAAIGGILRITIWLLKAYIWLRTHQAAWNTLGLVVKGFGVVLVILAGIAGVALAAIAAGAALVAAGIGLVGATIGEAYNAIVKFIAFVRGANFKDIGLAIVNGIANGIKAAGAAIYDSLKSAVGGAIDKVRNFIGAHSPARVPAALIGEPFGQGIAMGVRGSAPEVASAAQYATTAGVDAGVKTAKAAPTPTASGPAISFTNCTFGDGGEVAIRRAIHIAFEEELA